jgi:hypothetical protein
MIDDVIEVDIPAKNVNRIIDCDSGIPCFFGQGILFE